MKNILRAIALLMAIALPGLLLTACSTDDDCNAAGTRTVTVAAAAHLDGDSLAGKPKPKPKKAKIHHSDDCEDDD